MLDKHLTFFDFCIYKFEFPITAEVLTPSAAAPLPLPARSVLVAAGIHDQDSSKAFQRHLRGGGGADASFGDDEKAARI